MATQFFSMAEIGKLESWPAEIGRDELVQYLTLTLEDVAWVNKSARGTSAKLGLAVQLCALPWWEFVPEDVPAAPPAAASRLAVQLGPAGRSRGAESFGPGPGGHHRLVLLTATVQISRPPPFSSACPLTPPIGEYWWVRLLTGWVGGGYG